MIYNDFLMHRVFKKNGVFTIPFIPFLTNIAVKTFKAVNNHTYCPTIFCTANNSWMLARERQQICENYWITQYLMNTLYIQTTLSITIFTTKVLPSWKKETENRRTTHTIYGTRLYKEKEIIKITKVTTRSDHR